jgi:glucose-6-phosphate 1-dehydrogenase
VSATAGPSTAFPAPQPASLVIFGGAGDLARRKLLPALYNLHVDGHLPSAFAIVGAARTDLNDETYRAMAREAVERHSRREIDARRWQSFAAMLFFCGLDLQAPNAFPRLGARLDTIEHERGLPGSRVYYLAVPPALFGPTVEALARSVAPPGGDRFTRIIVEKPIGHDLASAEAINNTIADVFDERQVFRIDHYLGKETVQNILVLRFANSFFEPLFNHKYVDHVQITVAECDGIGGRAGYYDNAGALRDMVQNHLLQLLTLVGMEAPFSLDADVVRDEKLEVIQALRPIEGEQVDGQVVRGQYTAGVIGGTDVAAYRAESGVRADSRTETFIALEAFVDTWRWAGVPFFLRTGKRLPQRASEIALYLKAVPPILFNKGPGAPLQPNALVIRIQPDEGFALWIMSKVPGARLRIRPVDMDFSYAAVFGKSSPEAYERLLLDVLAGDTTLFMRRDMVEASWAWIMPILQRWTERPEPEVPTYRGGTWGPREADELLARTGRRWRTPAPHVSQ